MSVPSLRIRRVNQAEVRADGDFLLYWMIAFRRTRFNFALQHAVDLAKQLGKPLLIFEPLRLDYPWASDRFHDFIIAGMRDNAAATQRAPVTYFPYVEPSRRDGARLLRQLAQRACAVVSDEFPCFFLPRMIEAAAKRLPVAMDLVDSNGVMPLRMSERTFTVAHSYRRWMQKNIMDPLATMPKANPLARLQLPQLPGLPAEIGKRWPAAPLDQLLSGGRLSCLPIDHSVQPNANISGGPVAAGKRLKEFFGEAFVDYDRDRNQPDCRRATSGLSPYLHFGHISAHEIVDTLLDHEQWTPNQISQPNGKNHGFWNISTSGEAFLDQLLTWREIGFNMSHRHPDRYDQYESLPDWALQTLAEHAGDPRPEVYSAEQFEQARTHDELWNAAQRELVTCGQMHNYLRMLWGKKILHWSRSPQDALSIMIHLNNKYGLDGRDPNSYNGIFWVLGRYDRAWGPKRPVFGSVRYMTSDSTRRKLRVQSYLQRFAPQ